MFFILSKILFYVIMPLFWIFVLLLYSLFTKNRKRGRISLIIGLVTLYLFSNPFLLNSAWLAWEYDAVPVREVKKYDAAILLTGFTSLEKSPHDRVYTNKGADRFLHTVMLYKTGHFRKIIVSGGNGLTRKIYASEALEVRTLLQLAGVPAEDIILEDRSKNTHENAQFTKQLLPKYPDLKRLLLITSAFHMRRAEDCFTKAGVPVTVFPADFQSSDPGFGFNSLLPSEGALAGWGKLFHEVAGYLVYKIMGYC